VPAPATLEEEAAWALVRAALLAAREGTGPWRIELPASPDVWLEVDASGGWHLSAPPDDAARQLFEMFLPLAIPPDLVIGQLGQSLDGRIATASGDSHFITGPADIRRLHRLRALVDAVVVGAETVALDDPQLTVREVVGENPVRVVLDPDDRLSEKHRVFADRAAGTLVVRRAAPAPKPGVERPEEAVARSVVCLPAGPGGFQPAMLLEALRARGLRRVLVEGGGVTVSRFLQAGLLDRLHVTVAPLLLGSGRPAFTLPPIESLAEALRPKCRHFRLGDDLLFDLELK
jgi:riboflavin-specific deaminase-like protein